MAASIVIINVAYVALMAATFARTIVPLRMFLILSGVGFLVFGILIRNWSMVGWNVVTAGLHIRQLLLHVSSQRNVALSPTERTLRDRYLPDLCDFDFASLWSIGEAVEHADEMLVRRDEVHGRVWLILDGVVEVDRGSKPSVRLGTGALVGEMSFVSRCGASAAARAEGSVRLREWSHERLETLEVLNPVASKALQRFIQRDLVAKVT